MNSRPFAVGHDDLLADEDDGVDAGGVERLGVAAALALQVVDLAAVTVVALVVGHLRTLTWWEQKWKSHR